MKRQFSLLTVAFAVNILMAKVSVPYFFSDNMVLQRDAEIPVWGFANPGEKVAVKFKSQTKTVVTDASGNWKVLLKPEKFGGPYEMKISGENELVFKNVLVGDVWLCSGQSNMEWNLGRSEGFEAERNQKIFPKIRHIKIHKAINTFPNNNVEKTEWQTSEASTLADFSGVAYYFAKKMYEKTGIPIGLINSSWGGTNIETWISKEAFQNSVDFKDMISKMPTASIDELLKKNSDDKIALIESKLGSKITDFKANEFLKPDFNDSKLPEIYQPKIWEEQGFAGVDGITWVRKTITLQPEDLTGDAKLYLSQIDDNDITYFNGVKVGGIAQYDANRIYTVPKNLLKVGKNVITVQITDTGGGGGIYGNPNDVKLVTSKNTVSLVGNWKFAVEKVLKNLSENDFPSMAYNGMIAPLEQTKIKGIIWYQGESNTDRAVEYNKSFPLLINSWREKFGKDLPFYFVQLATFATKGNNNEGCDWCELREAQTNSLKLKNTGMVVTTDIGNPKDIHPRNKKTVGDRLANLALKNGIKSPILKDYKIEGNKISVGFTPNFKLKTSDKTGNVKGFEIAGNDKIFYPATAKIVGNRVVISSDKMKTPTAVRYGWKGDDSEINLFTEQNLPISPFRTDNFPLSTKDNHYKINLK